jgi:peptidoglycan/xylan/chitin deacetylase (PgdA/CDA1 family)
MSFRDAHARRLEQARERRVRKRRERIAALGSLILVVAVVATVVLTSVLGSGSHTSKHGSTASAKSSHASAAGGSSPGTGGTATVPILEYHVINVAPAGSSASPALYVPADEFSSQMAALKAAGWHAVTLDQLEAYWTRGVSLGPGKPIVITFDDGYASQYTNAVPVLKGLGWVGVENLQLSGLPPSEGGLTDSQIRGLIAAGWELDSEGMTGTDLTTVDPGALAQEVSGARQMLRSRYGVAANWFSYPLGHYNPTVIAAVRAAGFVGATTAVSGWASPQQDRYRLPRLEVVGGTSPSQLLSQIAAAQSSTSTPGSYSGPGTA